MSKELEELKIIRQSIIDMLDKGMKMDVDIALSLKERLDVIETALKALEIIKTKGNFINLEYDEFDDKYYIYDNELYMHNEITKEEYDLLEEVLR